MSESTECLGCGKNPCTNGCNEITNWSISCGCDSHGDHLGCSKECNKYGCVHPRGLELSGTLQETALYSDKLPPASIVRRAIEEERKRITQKANKKLQRLERIEKSLEEELA